MKIFCVCHCIRGAYFHAFQTNSQIVHTCLGPPKLRWPRAPRSLNPFLPLGRVAGAAALGGLEILHDQQQSEIVQLAQHQHGTKQGQQCNQSTWSVDNVWTVFS